MSFFCPCGSGYEYSQCCQKLHDGGYAENALALMRSRYSAYALQKSDYIIRTTHPDNPNYQANWIEWSKEILHFSQGTHFQKLEILEFIDGALEAFVTFKVHLIQNETLRAYTEKSRFLKVGPQWLYRDGVFLK